MIQSEERAAKGIGNSTTLARDVEKREDAEEVLKKLAEKVAGRLQVSGQRASMISVEIRYYNFQNTSHQKQLGKATDDGNVLYREACSLFEESWSGEPIRLLGVRTSKLVEEEQPEQLSIFDMQPVLEEARAKKEKKKKHQKLDAVMEQIKRRYGNDVIMRGTDRKH